MAVPTSAADLSTTASSNSPAGTDAIGTSLDDYLRGIQAIIKQENSKGTDIASSTSITIPNAGSYFVVTGTTTITTVVDSWVGRQVALKFSGALTLTHGSGFILPGGANITTAAGDCLLMTNESTGVWRVLSFHPYVGYQRYDADIPTVAASQAEMEAGTEAALRSMSPLRVAQAIDALSVQEGLWTDYSATSTVTGWVSFTSKLIYYKQVGKTIFVTFDIQGTSNATTASFTLPNTSSNTVDTYACAYTADSGTATTGGGLIFMAKNGTTVSIFKDMALAAFTNSGTKRVIGQIVYHAP